MHIEAAGIRLFGHNKNIDRVNYYTPGGTFIYKDLNTETYNIPTLLQFKSSIRHQPPRVGEHLSVSERKYNIILPRIRLRCSSLNADFFHVNIVPYSNCSCGVLIENT